MRCLFFSDFEITNSMMSWRPFFSRSQFVSDLLQNWTWRWITSPPICYLKSAKSVGNFRFYEEPRAVHDIWRSGVQSLLGKLFQIFCGWSYSTNSDLLVTNLIIFFFIKDVTSDLIGKILKNGRNCVSLFTTVLFVLIKKNAEIKQNVK